MTDREFINYIKRLWECADSIGIAQVFSNPVSVHLSHEYRDEAYSSSVRYESLYFTGICNSDYNILLMDYSYFQFSFDGKDKIRLVYFPNPFFGATPDARTRIGELHEYLREGLVEMEEFLQEIAEVRAPEIPPLIRYEYDATSYKELSHPASHLHVGYHSDNRWPVERILTPEAFGLLVIKLYYRQNWENTRSVFLDGVKLPIDEILIISKNKCQILEDDKLSSREKQQFFIS